MKKQRTKIIKTVVIQKEDKVFYVGIIKLKLYNLAYGGVKLMTYQKKGMELSYSNYKKYKKFKTLEEFLSEVYQGWANNNKEELANRLKSYFGTSRLWFS
jgi:hypothetical protein